MIMARKLKVRLARDHPGGGKFDLGHELPAARHLHVAQRHFSVEIGNTDAEGRLVLADALAHWPTRISRRWSPTSPRLPAPPVSRSVPNCRRPSPTTTPWAVEFAAAGLAESDPSWRLPLWRPTRRCSISRSPTPTMSRPAARAAPSPPHWSLCKFVAAKSWLHLDLFAWNTTAKLGRPEGGETPSPRARSPRCSREIFVRSWSRLNLALMHSAQSRRRSARQGRGAVSSRARVMKWSSRRERARGAVG